MNHRKFIPSNFSISIGLFGIALFVRILYLRQLFLTPLWVPIGDGKVYQEMAQAIASGQIIQKEAFYLHPLYPYLVGLIYTIFNANIITILLLQAILGAASVVLIYQIGLKAFNRGTALIASLIYSLYQPAIYFTGTFLGVTVTIFLLLWGIYYFLDNYNDNRSYIWIICGFIFGLAVLSRFTIVLCLMSLSLYFILQKRWKESVCLLLGCSFVFIPVAIHNYLAEKQFLLFTSHGGVTFYHTNHHGCGGFPEFGEFRIGNVETIHKVSIDLARKESGKMLSSAEVSNFWYKKTMEFIKQYPFEFLNFLWLRFTLFWNNFEIPSNYNIYFFREQIPFLQWFVLFNYQTVAILFLPGLLFVLGDWKRYLWLLLIIGTYGASLMVFFVYARFRIVIVPLMLLVSAYGLNHLWDSIKEHQWKEIGLYALYIGIGFFIIQNRIYSKEQFIAQNYNALGYAHEQLKHFPEAVEAYKKALQAEPDYSLFYYNLGTAYVKNENYKEGETILKTALSKSPPIPETFFNLAFAQEYLANYDSALINYQRFLTISPDTIDVYFRIGTTYYKMKKYMDAEKYFKAVYETTKSIECLWYLGMCAAERNDPSTATNYLNEYINKNGMNWVEAKEYLQTLKK